jgi:hypothetical protein
MTIRGLILLLSYLALTFAIAKEASDPYLVLGIMIASAIFLVGFYHMTKPYVDIYNEVKNNDRY